MTRTSVLLWSAASGFVIGLLAGLLALAALVIAVNVLPGVPERLVTRMRTPALVALLGVLPIAGAVLGYLEGRAKLH